MSSLSVGFHTHILSADSQDPIDYNNLNVVISNDARYLLPPTVYRDRRSVTPESPYEADFSSPASSPQTRYPDFDHSELRGDLYQLNIASASDSQVDYFSYEQPSPALSHNSALSYGSASSFANSSENCSLSPLRFPSPNGFVMNSQMPGYPAAQDPTGSYLFLPTPNDILPEHQVHLAFPPTSPYSPSGNFPPTMFTQSLLVDKPPPPSPSGASDSSKHNLEESLNDIMTDIQAGNPTEIQSMLIQDVSSKAGPDVKHLFGKPAKASVCSLAGLAASGKRRKKPAKFACNFKDCLATFTRNAGLKSTPLSLF